MSTPSDLNTFIRGYAKGKLFDPQTRARQRRVFEGGHSEPPGPGKNSAGLGIFRYETSCGTVWGHTGNIPGGYTQFMVAGPDGKRSATVSINAQITPTVADPQAFEALRVGPCARRSGARDRGLSVHEEGWGHESPSWPTFDYSTNLLEEACSRKFAWNFTEWHYSLSEAGRPHPRTQGGKPCLIPAAVASILLAEGVEGAEIAASLVAFAVVATLLLQATTAGWLARRLGLIEEPRTEAPG